MDYEEEFSETFDRIERYLNEYKGQGNRNLERDIEKNIELASKLSSRMEAESMEMEVKRKAEKFQQKVKKSRLEFERIKNQLNKDSLMMDKNYSESDSLLTDSRTKNLGNMKRVEDSSTSISRSIQILDDIEVKLVNILNFLESRSKNHGNIERSKRSNYWTHG
jgi:hypothetical protein